MWLIKRCKEDAKVFSKKNEFPKQHVTVSKPDIALKESGNSIKIVPSAPVTDERYIPPHRRDEVGLNNKLFAPNCLSGQNGNSNNLNINKPNQQIFGRTNPILQPGVYEQEERGTGGNFPQGYMPNP